MDDANTSQHNRLDSMLRRYYFRLVIEDIGARYHGTKTVEARVTADTEHDARRTVVETALTRRVWVKRLCVKKIGNV